MFEDYLVIEMVMKFLEKVIGQKSGLHATFIYRTVYLVVAICSKMQPSTTMNVIISKIFLLYYGRIYNQSLWYK